MVTPEKFECHVCHVKLMSAYKMLNHYAEHSEEEKFGNTYKK
jgi:hypothetical protein